MKTLNKVAIVAVVAAVSGATNAANIVGAQSVKDNDVFYIEVGESNVPFGPHSSGKAGIGSSNSVLLGSSMRVDFEALASSKKVSSVTDKGATVYQLNDPIIKKGEWYEFHRNLGNFSFLKVGSGDVWIGEWSRKGGPEFANRQVYYVGEHEGTSVPLDGSATYTTYGVNKFTGDNLLVGTLTANFGNRKLNGSITNGSMTLSINDADITPASATFSGNATVANVAGSGTAKGHFFGDQAAALAGIAEFSDKDLNTAFGGTKN